MGRTPSPSRRRRSRSRDRVERVERDRDRKRRRSRSRERREPEHRRDRKRSGERDFRRKSWSRSRSRSPDKQRYNKQKQQPSKPNISAADLEGKTEEEQDMLKMMGFCGFSTTKNTKVEENNAGEVHVILKRKYRQYMNRKGGFNRPLDFVA